MCAIIPLQLLTSFIALHTHTHTHTYIYMCVCVCVCVCVRVRARAKQVNIMSEDKICSGQMVTILLLLRNGEYLATYQEKLTSTAGVT